MSKENCSKNEIFNRFEKKCESKDTHKGILLNSKSGKYKFLKNKTLHYFLELNLEELKTYCKEMIPTYDCSKIQNKKDLIKLISNKINIETGDLFCKSGEYFDKKDRKCSKIPTTPPKSPQKPKTKSPQKPKSKSPQKPKTKSPQKPKTKSKSPQKPKTKSPQKPKTKSPQKPKTKSKSPAIKDEHNYSIIFLKKAKKENIVTKLSKKNIDKNIAKLNKYIKKIVYDCEKRINYGKNIDNIDKTSSEYKKRVISKYFYKYVMPENILKPLFSELFSITKYSEENYHLIILMEIFILYILNNNITEFIDKDFEITDKAELKTKMYFHKEKEPVSESSQIINIQSPSMRINQNGKFNINILVKDDKPVSYIKYVEKFLDICNKYKLKGESYNASYMYPKLQQLLLESDIKFKELISQNPPRTFYEFKNFIKEFMENHVLKNEDKIISEFKEIFPKMKHENGKRMLMIIPLLLVKMLFKNMYVDITYVKDISETE